MRLANLLPEQDKKTYQKYLMHLYLRRFLKAQGLVLVVLLVILSAQFVYLAIRVDGLKGQITELQKFNPEINVEDMQATAAAHNEGLKAASSILKAKANFSTLLDELGKLIPNGVTIDSVDITSSPASMAVKGRANTRENIVSLQNSLERSSTFTKTYAPLSNLTAARDGNFQFVLSFDLNKLISR